MKIEPNNCYNMDCIEGMQLMIEQGIKADWCITDPPYGISTGKMAYTKQGIVRNGKAQAKTRDYRGQGKWDNERISKEYFDLIMDCSNEQIIFGGELLHRYFSTYKKLDSME